MNFKNLLFIAAILMVAVCIAPVMGESDYTSKYAAPPSEPVQDGCGSLYVVLGCGHNLITKDFTIQRVEVTNATFTNGQIVSGEFIDAYVTRIGDPKIFDFGASGRWDERIAPGTFLLTISDGNGGHPEQALVTVYLSERSSVKFLGHAVSMAAEEPEEVCKIVIIRALYGMQSEVVDVPAWDETITDTAAWDEQVVDVPAHREYRIYVYDGHWNGWHWVDTSYWTEWSDIKPYGWNSAHSRDKQTRNVDATYKTIHHDATTHIVHHDAIMKTVGSYIDVTSDVQSVVDMGKKSFIFDNRPASGGIFDTDGITLLKGIADPANGQIKKVTITYNSGCGGSDKTINANEYDLINL